MSSPARGIVMVFAAALLASGCATVGSGQYASAVDDQGRPTARQPGQALVSVGELTELASEHFGALEITFENPSSQWIRITGVELDFGSAALNQAVLIPAGEDLQSWQEAISTRNAIAATNRETVLGAIALGGAVLGAIADRGSAGEALGDLAAAGAITTIAAGRYSRTVRQAESVRTFPSTHLFSGPFGVPPGLFAKRWVVLNSQGLAQKKCLREAYLTYQTGGLPAARVRLDYGAQRAGSRWQRSQCHMNAASRAP